MNFFQIFGLFTPSNYWPRGTQSQIKSKLLKLSKNKGAQVGATMLSKS